MVRTSSAAQIIGVSVAYIEGLQLVGIVDPSPAPGWLTLPAFIRLVEMHQDRRET